MTTLSAIPLACAVTLLLSAATPSLETDAVFRAMDDELARSMKELTLEGAAPPYFMALRLQDSDVATVRARYGALVEKEQHLDRYLSVEVRVGDPSLDNTGFIGSWEDLYNMRTDVPEEDAYWSLRHEIWLAVDDAYKRAVETLSRKKAHLQTHPTTEPVPDFSSAPSLVHGGGAGPARGGSGRVGVAGSGGRADPH